MICKYFLPVCRLPFNILTLQRKSFKFNKIQCICFFFFNFKVSHLRTLHLTQWFSTSNPLSPWGICNVWRYFWSHIVRYLAKYPIVHRTSSYNKHLCVCSVTQSCLSLCELMDCGPPASSTSGIFQARTLEWVAISCSRGSFRPRDRTRISCVSCIGRQILYH